MSDHPAESAKPKKERSPSFPFIPLRKAVERAQAMYDAHRREPTRIVALASTWDYAPKSSGLSQTIAALKQFGLVEDMGSGDDRKIKLSDRAHRILVDSREGARESALKEAATSPRLISEYLSLWLPERPSDAHCVSELQLDRGFSPDAAKLFLRVFDDTVRYASLENDDSLSEVGQPEDAEVERVNPNAERKPPRDDLGKMMNDLMGPVGPKPLMDRLDIKVTAGRLTVSSVLLSGDEVDVLVQLLNANKLAFTASEKKKGEPS